MLIDIIVWGYSSTPKPFTCACGTAYLVWSEKRPEPDPGDIWCEVCDAHVVSWEGSRVWFMKRGDVDLGRPASSIG
jgi:hypothetical protein